MIKPHIFLIIAVAIITACFAGCSSTPGTTTTPTPVPTPTPTPDPIQLKNLITYNGVTYGFVVNNGTTPAHVIVRMNAYYGGGMKAGEYKYDVGTLFPGDGAQFEMRSNQDKVSVWYEVVP